MLKRLYVHNYKCLVNFEINFDQDISLFLGANGSGKSTVFDILSKIVKLVIHEEKVFNVFAETDFPRFISSIHTNLLDTDVIIEMTIETINGDAEYKLKLGCPRFDIRIRSETIYLDNMIVFPPDGKQLLYDENSLFVGERSTINRLGSDNIFIRALKELFIVRINPYQMFSTIKRSNSYIEKDFSNFSEWFAYLNEKNRRGVSVFEQAMRDILVGFDYFKIEQAGQAKVLQVEFENKSNKKEIISYFFDELSEGQKVLIALYTLIYCTPDNSIICIDEPENFLALPEIQPWFDALYDQCAERNLQALLISHHPKIINLLANDSGYWFSRQNNLTRIQKITAEDESGLSIAELIERGWIYEH